MSEREKLEILNAAKLIKTHCKSCNNCIFVKNINSAHCPLDKPPYYWDIDDIRINDNCKDAAENVSYEELIRASLKNVQKIVKVYNEGVERHIDELKQRNEELRKMIENNKTESEGTDNE